MHTHTQTQYHIDSHSLIQTILNKLVYRANKRRGKRIELVLLEYK